MTIAFILTTSVQALPSCDSKLREFEQRLEQWSRARRSISDDNEQHTYHKVKKDGATVHMTILTTRAALAYERQLQAFRLDSACAFDGEEGVTMFKIEVVK
jgi:hypothetical protein